MITCLKNSKGFSLIEALIAIVIISIGLLALGNMQIGAMKANTNSQARTVAVALAQSQLDTLRALPFDSDALAATASLDTGYVSHGVSAPADADHGTALTGPNGISYEVFWNVLADTPIDGTRTIRLFVTWRDQRFGPSKVILTSVLGGGFYL